MMEKFIPLTKSLSKRTLNDQVKELQKKLNEAFQQVQKYQAKQEDQVEINEVLDRVKVISMERNKAVHSVLIGTTTGGTIQVDRHQYSQKNITSAEIYVLANNIFDLQSRTGALKFCINRLRAALQPKS
jgi:regulator of replication initiation timing